MRRRRKAREEEEGGFHGNRLVSRETRGGDVSAEAGMLGRGPMDTGSLHPAVTAGRRDPILGGGGECVHQHGGL